MKLRLNSRVRGSLRQFIALSGALPVRSFVRLHDGENNAEGGLGSEWVSAQKKAPHRLAGRGTERIVGVGNDVGKATNTGRAVKFIPCVRILRAGITSRSAQAPGAAGRGAPRVE
jgi:hypothetical protein